MHVAKTISMPLLREVQLVFHEELSAVRHPSLFLFLPGFHTLKVSREDCRSTLSR